MGSGLQGGPESLVEDGLRSERHVVVRIDDVVKRFEAGVVAVEDVSLSVRRGEFVALVGPSGCGKSTLLRLLAGLVPATSGTLELNGSLIAGPRQDVGLMFQRPTLLAWKTALENVLLPARLRRSGGDDRRRQARDLLSMLGLSGFEHAYPRHLSGGMQQRVALARLLMIGADVLLLDEPFAAVDELTRERLNLELLDLYTRTGATIVLVTHNINESVLLADRVVVMTPRPGRISREVAVPLPRPRDLAMTRTSEYQELVFQVREGLGHLEAS